MHAYRQGTGFGMPAGCRCQEMMSTGQGRIGRRGVLGWIGRIAAGSAVAVWQPGTFAHAATAKGQPGQRIVVIDPGHGGLDPGAIGVTGSYEKDITLSTAELAAALLESTRRYKVVLTRREDDFIARADPVWRPLAAPGDLFLSVRP